MAVSDHVFHGFPFLISCSKCLQTSIPHDSNVRRNPCKSCAARKILAPLQTLAATAATRNEELMRVIEPDVVSNWDDMEKIQHCMTQKSMIETLNLPATCVATQATDVYSFTAVAEREFVQDAPEKPCYTGFDYDTEHKSINKEGTCKPSDENIIAVGPKRFRCAEVSLQPKTHELPDANISAVGVKRFRCAEVWVTHELPDENVINVCAKRFRCAEVLFRPSLTGQMIMKCDVDSRKNLYTNVVLSSGARRVTMKLTAMCHPRSDQGGCSNSKMDWRLYLVFPRFFTSV